MYGREPTKQEYAVPRSTKEIYGRYLTFDEPLPWYKREKPMVVVFCAAVLLIAFSIYRGAVL